MLECRSCLEHSSPVQQHLQADCLQVNQCSQWLMLWTSILSLVSERSVMLGGTLTKKSIQHGPSDSTKQVPKYWIERLVSLIEAADYSSL